MSPLSPRLRIALTPGGAAAAGAGWRAEGGRGEGIEGGLAALDGLLAERKPRGAAEVLLSHHFVHLGLAVPPPIRLRRAETEAWLRERLAERCGEEARGWVLRWQAEPPGRPLAYCALQPEILDGLRDVLARHRLRLAGLQPWLTAAFNRRRRALAGPDAWLALLEPGRLTLARLQAGRWALLAGRRLDDGDAAAQLPLWLARESAAAGLPAGGDVWLECVGLAGDGARLPEPFSLHGRGGRRDGGAALQMLER